MAEWISHGVNLEVCGTCPASRRKQNARTYEMGFDLCNDPASAEPTPRLGELPGFESRYRSLSGGSVR